MFPISAAEIREMDHEGLERLFAHEAPIAVPKGLFDGSTLERLDNPGAQHPVWRRLEGLGFERTPFGVDFDRHRWFFHRPKLGIGRFEARVGRSRWRDTRAVILRYDRSRLPSPVKSMLYDEVKPLGPDLVLGLGGIDAGRNHGDHFFFLLERRHAANRDAKPG